MYSLFEFTIVKKLAWFNASIWFISFLKEFIGKYNIRCVYGRDMVTVSSDLLPWMKSNWRTKEYDDINFSIWFDMDEQDIPSDYRLDKALIKEK